MREKRQNESGRRLFLKGSLALGCSISAPLSVRAQGGGDLDAGGLTFRDFGKADNGASFARGDSMLPAGPDPANARLLGIDKENGLARVQFVSIRVEVSLPLGWQATEDPERGVGFSADRHYRAIVWRVDFTFEGVRDAEQYASAKMGAIKARRRGVEARTRKLSDGTFLIVYENVPPSSTGDAGNRTVFDLVITNPANPKQGVLLTLGVPGGDTDRGIKLLALLKSQLVVTW